ncbi:MAG: ECF transporter S component [Bacteroidales bacterium]|nr:ECF transporter S component [Bacteroidales bacterium]
MLNTAVYQLRITEAKTYLMAALFVVGNIVVPQLCHLMPKGGLIFLPIYFFTLIAAYKYGMIAGLMTAICSPLVNHILFAMPPTHALPILLIKSTLLAIIAATIARRVGRVALWAVALSVVGYQLAGLFFEWPMTGSLYAALQDIRIGYPGMLIQIFFGYALLRYLK